MIRCLPAPASEIPQQVRLNFTNLLGFLFYFNIHKHYLIKNGKRRARNKQHTNRMRPLL